eukprot:scaffold213_cov245-Pinguiococcus_pyrenoidosus.AAC.46
MAQSPHLRQTETRICGARETPATASADQGFKREIAFYGEIVAVADALRAQRRTWQGCKLRIAKLQDLRKNA